MPGQEKTVLTRCHNLPVIGQCLAQGVTVAWCPQCAPPRIRYNEQKKRWEWLVNGWQDLHKDDLEPVTHAQLVPLPLPA